MHEPLPETMTQQAKDFILLFRREIDPVSPKWNETIQKAWDALERKNQKQVARYQGWALPGEVYG